MTTCQLILSLQSTVVVLPANENTKQGAQSDEFEIVVAEQGCPALVEDDQTADLRINLRAGAIDVRL